MSGYVRYPHHIIKKIILIGIPFLFIAVVIFSLLRVRDTSTTFVSPVPDEKKPSIFERIFAKKKDMNILKESITKIIGSQWENYSVLVYNFKDGTQLSINEHSIHTAASVNKLPILATAYYLAQKGEIDLDKIIVIQEKDIQDYGTGSIRYQKPGSTYTIKTLLSLMMKQSDNTAAYILGNYVIGMEKMQTIIQGWGMTQTDMERNKTSAHDTLVLMKKIYEERVANHALTLDMLSTMKDTDFEDRLPAKLPDDANVYHKIGTEVGIAHDVGIVDSTSATYFIAVLSSNVHDELSAPALISDISKTVYDFMK